MATARRQAKIVVTPGSGQGRATATARRVRHILQRRGWETSIEAFADLSTLACWARGITPDFTHLVCVGGDATLSAAATLAARAGIVFVPVPNGFGNVFARVFGHPDRAEEVARLLEHGEVCRVDVGRFGDEIFLSHRSYGLLEQIQQAAERGRRQPRSRLLRHLWYYGVARQFFAGARLASIRVEVDGKLVAGDAVLVTVANVETYRDFLSLTPSASPVDGMFDVFVMPRVSGRGPAWRLLKLFLRLPGRWRGVGVYRGRRVVVTTGGRSEELRSARRALRLLVPPGAIEALRQRTGDDEAPIATAS